MKGEGFVHSLESGGKRFALLAGSNRRNLVFRERASLVVKVQSNRAFIGPFVGVAEEICLAPAIVCNLPCREPDSRRPELENATSEDYDFAMSDPALGRPSRRHLLSLIGAAAGGSAMYQAMSSLGFAAESS